MHFRFLKKHLKQLRLQKYLRSAIEAKSLAIFLKSDTVIINNDQRIKAAKDKALSLLSDGYEPPAYREDLKLPGSGGRTAMAIAVKGFKSQGKISEHDEFIAKKTCIYSYRWR